MGRAVYAYRDMDEELFFPLADGDDAKALYQSHQSPPLKIKDAKAALSESTILRSHLDISRSKMRRKLCAVGFVLLLTVLALIPLLDRLMETDTEQSELEWTVEGPYSALRGAHRQQGDRPSRQEPTPEELTDLFGENEPDVGEPDDAGHVDAGEAEQDQGQATIVEDNDSSDD